MALRVRSLRRWALVSAVCVELAEAGVLSIGRERAEGCIGVEAFKGQWSVVV